MGIWYRSVPRPWNMKSPKGGVWLWTCGWPVQSIVEEVITVLNVCCWVTYVRCRLALQLSAYCHTRDVLTYVGDNRWLTNVECWVTLSTSDTAAGMPDDLTDSSLRFKKIEVLNDLRQRECWSVFHQLHTTIEWYQIPSLLTQDMTNDLTRNRVTDAPNPGQRTS